MATVGKDHSAVSLLMTVCYAIIRLYLGVIFRTFNNWYVVGNNHQPKTIRQIIETEPTINNSGLLVSTSCLSVLIISAVHVIS